MTGCGANDNRLGISDNVISENSVSDNSASVNAVSDNAVSENEVENVVYEERLLKWVTYFNIGAGDQLIEYVYQYDDGEIGAQFEILPEEF